MVLPLTVPGQNADTSRGTAVNEASADYFRLLHATLLSGRASSEQDVTIKPPARRRQRSVRQERTT